MVKAARGMGAHALLQLVRAHESFLAEPTLVQVHHLKQK